MKTTTYRVIINNQKQISTPISVMRVSPDGQPKYVLQLIHGIAEHKGRYTELMEYAAAHGAEVIMHDLPGHGQSVPSMDQLGVMPDPGYDYADFRLGIDAVFSSIAVMDYGSGVSEDESGLLVTVDSPEDMDFPIIPRFLLGHSMGSLIAGTYTARQPETLDGLILIGLPFRHKTASIGVFLMKLLEGIFGEEAKPSWMNKLAFSSYDRKFTPEPQSDGQFMWLSTDIDNRYEFLADPLCNSPKAIRTFTILLSMVRDFHRPAFWDMHRPDLPIQLMAGDLDPVAGGDRQILADQKFLRDIGFREVSALMYPGFRHEILRDFCREEAFRDVIRFCEEHLDAANQRIDALLAQYAPQFSDPDEPANE